MQNALERVPLWRDGWRRSGRLVLLLVDQEGAACHTGERSCFYRTLPSVTAERTAGA